MLYLIAIGRSASQSFGWFGVLSSRWLKVVDVVYTRLILMVFMFRSMGNLSNSSSDQSGHRMQAVLKIWKKIRKGKIFFCAEKN